MQDTALFKSLDTKVPTKFRASRPTKNRMNSDACSYSWPQQLITMPLALTDEAIRLIIALATDGESTCDIVATTRVSRLTIYRRLLYIKLYGKPYLPN